MSSFSFQNYIVLAKHPLSQRPYIIQFISNNGPSKSIMFEAYNLNNIEPTHYNIYSINIKISAFLKNLCKF